MATILVKYRLAHLLTYMPLLVVNVVVNNIDWASSCWGLARQTLFLLDVCCCFMGLGWAETQKGSWGGRPARWWGDQRRLLAHR